MSEFGYVTVFHPDSGNVLADFDDTMQALQFVRAAIGDPSDIELLWRTTSHEVSGRAMYLDFMTQIRRSLAGPTEQPDPGDTLPDEPNDEPQE